MRAYNRADRTEVVGYFDNSTALFPGDDVRILGVPVGQVASVEPQPDGVKISFWFDRKYKVPADAKAAILSPMLVTGRAIQLTPVYTGGPAMRDGAVIPRNRTVVPVEWDQVRGQLQRLTELLKPTAPGGVSTLGSFINTAADNLRGEGGNIRDTIIKLSQAMSVLGDHSGDIFATFKNLSILVTALRGSSDLLGALNENLASVTGLLANDPTKIGDAFAAMNSVIGDVKTFIDDTGETIGTTTDKLASISTALNDSLDDIKQTLHIAPTTVANFTNIYEASNGAFTGALAVNNFANPISFLCGAIQAASRLGAEQSSKLCVQYLAPIIKNRQFNFPPIGENFLVGAQARPNEVTYSEDWLRPDYVPPAAAPAPTPPAAQVPLAAEGTPLGGNDCRHGSHGRIDRDDDSPRRRWLVKRHLRGLTAVAVVLALAAGSSGCGLKNWQGLNSLSLPGTEGNGPGSFTVAGRNARHQQHSAQFPGSRRRCDRRPYHEDRTPRLARPGDDASQRRCRIAGQRDGQDRLDLHPRLPAHRTQRPQQCTRTRATARGIADPAVQFSVLPHRRTNPCRGLHGAQWWRSRSDPGHH